MNKYSGPILPNEDDSGALDDARALYRLPSATLVAKTQSETDTAPTFGDTYPHPTMDPVAYHGILGDFVRLVAPETEADPAGILAVALSLFGIASGPNARVHVAADIHHARTSVVLVGDTADGGKGMATNHALSLFRIADEEWLSRSMIRGLASGEAFIERLAEAPDKNVAILDPEYSRTLAVGHREGAILLQIVREMFDSGDLANNTKKKPTRVSGVHAGIVGNITPDELRATLTTTDLANGSANRVLYIAVRTSRDIPDGGNFDESRLAPVAERLRSALEFARRAGPMRRSPAANAIWDPWYRTKPKDGGLLRAVLARRKAHVLRLSMIYALADKSVVIEAAHVKAALAVWNYAADSARHIFGASIGDRVTDRIWEELKDRFPDPLTRSEMRGFLGNKLPSASIDLAVDYLKNAGLARRLRIESKGRFADAWVAIPL